MPKHSTDEPETGLELHSQLVIAVLNAVARETSARKAYGPTILADVAREFGVKA